jgi:hypothetical protein
MGIPGNRFKKSSFIILANRLKGSFKCDGSPYHSVKL